MTNKQIDNISYLDALRLLQARKTKNLDKLVQSGAADLKKYARTILRKEKKST